MTRHGSPMLIVYPPATAVPGIAVDVALLGELWFVLIPRLEWSRQGSRLTATRRP